MSIVVPAVLPSSLDELSSALELFAKLPSIDRIQIDTVDGRFASPATWPYTAKDEFRAMVARGWRLPNLSRWTYEIDMMNEDAETASKLWLDAGASRLVFHAEASRHLPLLLAGVRRRYGHGDGLSSGMLEIGMALNIATDLSLLEPLLDQLDFVQLMGIAEIGKQGQPFDTRVVERVRTFHTKHPEVPVQVDGGVTEHTAEALYGAGARRLVVGHALLRAQEPAKVLAELEAVEPLYGV